MTGGRGETGEGGDAMENSPPPIFRPQWGQKGLRPSITPLQSGHFTVRQSS